MASLTIEDVMSTALAYVYGKSTAVICLIQILALLKFHQQLFDRSVNLLNLLCRFISSELFVMFQYENMLACRWYLNGMISLTIFVILYCK